MGVVLLLLALLAGLARAIHDTGTHAPEKLAGWGPFWDNRTSWLGKYKHRDPLQGPAFWGATTFLVGFTDGWHLTNLVAWAAADAAVLLVAWAGPYRWWAVGYVVARRLVFQPVYSWLRK